MNAELKCAIAIMLYSVTAAASAYEGFDPYSDPTPPTVARASGARSGAIASAKSGSTRTAQATAAARHGHALPTHHVLAMRSTSVQYRGAPITRNDAHARELN